MTKDFDTSGVWHSTYHYTGTKPAGEFSSEHDVKIYGIGNQIAIQSLPNEEGSFLFLRLTLDGRILTGTWQEETSPTGHYKGEIYYGAIQFLIDEDGNAMRGKWVGFNRRSEVQSGSWELVRTDIKQSGQGETL